MVDEVWPLVRQEVPPARLRLVGDRPPAALRSRPELGIEVTGFVADLDAEHRGARVALAPLTTATGLKVKVPQAMAYGLPVVLRPAAAEGVALAPPDALGGTTDDPRAFAAAVVRLLRDRDHAARTGQRAARWVRSQFDAEADARGAVGAYAAAGSSRA